jgi:hypothetical protein
MADLQKVSPAGFKPQQFVECLEEHLMRALNRHWCKLLFYLVLVRKEEDVEERNKNNGRLVDSKDLPADLLRQHLLRLCLLQEQ